MQQESSTAIALVEVCIQEAKDNSDTSLNIGVIMKVPINHIFPNATRALAGFIKCKCCNGALVQITGKGGGRYGCNNAKRDGCNNKQRISKGQVEAIILNDLKEKFLTAYNLKYIDGLALKGLLGVIEPEPVAGKYSLTSKSLIEGCSYYVAYTSIQTIALLEEEHKSEVWAQNST